MKAEWYRKDQLLAFHAHRRCWKRSSIAHRAERQAIERGIPAAAGQLDGNQRAVSPDDEADRCDPVEVDPRGLARGYSRPELALIGRKRGLFLIILGLRRRDLGFRRGASGTLLLIASGEHRHQHDEHDQESVSRFVTHLF